MFPCDLNLVVSIITFIFLIQSSEGFPQRDAKFFSFQNLRSVHVNPTQLNYTSFPFIKPLWMLKYWTLSSSSKTNHTGDPTKSSVHNETVATNEVLIPNDDKTERHHEYSCPPCWCGVPNRMDRIVGGWATEINEYPWMVALLQNNNFFCGGTLISDRYVLTAAHCVRTSKRHKNLTVLFSEHNRASMHETETESRHVSKVIIHPKYNANASNHHDNDIALLKLASPITFKTNISPACLSQPGNKYTSQLGTVVGWGRISEQGEPSAELMATQVPILSNTMCAKVPNIAPKLTNNMMCAGYLEGGKDSCQGDSGGALLTENLDGRLLIAGVVSWGIGCARPNSPGVYTRVNQYIDWMEENTRDGCFCF